MIPLQVFMLVPLIRVTYLNEADSLFRETGSHQTLPSKILGDRIVEAVELLCGLRFSAQVLQTRCLGLHPERKLEGFDSTFQLAVRTCECELRPIHLLTVVDLHALDGARRLGICDKRDFRFTRSDPYRSDRSSRVWCRQEGGSEIIGAAVRLRRADSQKARHR